MTTVAPAPPFLDNDTPPQTRCACGFLHPGPAGTECTTCQAMHQAIAVHVTPAPRLHALTTTLIMPAAVILHALGWHRKRTACDRALTARCDGLRTTEDWAQVTCPQCQRRRQTASGKVALRLPKSLHHRAALLVAREGVSLNQWLVATIAESVGTQQAAEAEAEERGR